MLLLLHGTGGDEHDLIDLGAQLDPSAALLGPRGQVREGTANRFFRRLAEGVFDLEDLVARTRELGGFVRRAAEAYGVGSVPVIAVGYSNGANIALSLLLRDPRLLAGAALLRAMPQARPAPMPDLRGVPVLVCAGKFDRLVPPALLDELARLLDDAKANTQVSVSPAGHELAQADLIATRRWLAARGEAQS